MSIITGVVFNSDRRSLTISVANEQLGGSLTCSRETADEIGRLLVPDGKVTEVVKGIICRTVKAADEHKAEADELVRRYGSKDQIQRQTAGLLPDEEFRELVRRHVFGPVMVDVDGHPFPKFDGLEYGFTHQPGCSGVRRGGTDGQPFFRFSSGPVLELPPRAWETFKRLKHLVANLDAREPAYSWNLQGRFHTATCKECGETQTEFGALVSIQIAGRKLSREYQL